MIAFGPVPSRRLGRSLGINNIRPKTCSHACAYCQLGNTLSMQIDRSSFYGPDAVVQSVREKVASARGNGEPVDYLAFIPDGEPTLDRDLEAEILRLAPLETPVAVITNASLLWQEDVRRALALADWVSVKVDAVEEAVWRRVDRPHKALTLSVVLDGVLRFADEFPGDLVTETMLVRDVNADERHICALAGFLARLRPKTSYLAVPTRPPAEAWVKPPREETVNRAFQIVAEHVDGVELLIGYEGDAFSFTEDAREDLLSITAVHPMRRSAVDAFLRKADARWSLVDDLVDAGLLVVSEYEGHRYYARRLQPDTPNGVAPCAGPRAEERGTATSEVSSMVRNTDESWFRRRLMRLTSLEKRAVNSRRHARRTVAVALELLPSVNLAPGARCLELGCGQGALARLLVERFEARVTATDFDPAQVDLARSRVSDLGERVSVEVADARDLPYEDGAFDAVFSFGVMHHIAGGWRQVVAEVSRVLSPNGVFVFTDIYGARWVMRLLRVFARNLDPLDFGPLTEVLGRNGLKITSHTWESRSIGLLKYGKTVAVKADT
jgi:wyosine [tRNA(Phe)-imidazoG37] synthetase (radical SAM superfamily)/SAM-dependent methyltransferase